MNSALRLAKILEEVRTSTESIAFEAFEKVFEVKGCAAVSNKLRLCETQISVLEEKAHKSLTIFLKKTFNCKALQRNIQNERSQFSSYIMALETTGAYMPKENIDSKNITELAELLQSMKGSIEKSDMEKHYKDVLNSYADEMLEGIIDIDIGGIEAFTSHAEIANGKVVLYNEAFVESGMMETVNKIYEKSTKILSDGQTWSGAIGFFSGKFLDM